MIIIVTDLKDNIVVLQNYRYLSKYMIFILFSYWNSKIVFCQILKQNLTAIFF